MSQTRVISFNIRCDVVRDGDNAWPHRRAFVADLLRSHDADLIGTQEVLAHQGDYLVEQLTEYSRVGTGREDNQRQGEAAAIFFRRDRYELIDSGQSWLSPTPSVVNSMGWDAVCTRIVVWTVLHDRKAGRPIVFANTHFDHQGEIARLESARLVRSLLTEIARKHAIDATILSGDFNCTEGSSAYSELVRSDSELTLVDAFRAANPNATDQEASFNGFTGERAGKRIDWILTSPAWRAKSGQIDRTTCTGRFPSDHYPLVVELEEA